jgi:hypothetical protein
MMKSHSILLMSFAIAAAAVMTAQTPAASDWPQWRGPDRTGLSKETGLLKQWPPS